VPFVWRSVESGSSKSPPHPWQVQTSVRSEAVPVPRTRFTRQRKRTPSQWAHFVVLGF
jgi:hypothetical protein